MPSACLVTRCWVMCCWGTRCWVLEIADCHWNMPKACPYVMVQILTSSFCLFMLSSFFVNTWLCGVCWVHKVVVHNVVNFVQKNLNLLIFCINCRLLFAVKRRVVFILGAMHCSKAVFYVFVFDSIDDSATKHNLSPHIFYWPGWCVCGGVKKMGGISVWGKCRRCLF